MTDQSEIRNQQSEILLCPGQGAQSVGMGKAWAEKHPVAAATFDEADSILGIKLGDLCFNGPDTQLNRTDIAQAALYTCSVASYRALKELGKVGTPTVTAGLSLGEFTALHLAGAFDFATGLKLVRLRGQAMQDAAEATRSTMVAVTGDVTEEKIIQLCDKARGGGVLVPANYNSSMQVVVSGSIDACERAVAVANEMGFKPTPLTVAGAFHSPLMQPAADRLAAALAQVSWHKPFATVLSNVTAGPHDGNNPSSIAKLLVSQLTSPVRWSQSMTHAVATWPGARFIELAPGKVLSGLMRRIDKSAKVENFAEPA